ncbi:YciI family protein [Amaricoccus macauensis]|uniref:YciI family protein n=1 Tax=Amaricoccus macauensis TaxID=57001 RepID=UPI003C7B74C6
MLFALICNDKPGHLETRKANREAHLAYIAETGVVEQAGPLLDAEGNMCGSLVILDVADMAAAEAWAANDPYTNAELFASAEVRPWKRVIG